MWCNLEGVRGCNQKTSKNEPENQLFGLIFKNFQTALKTVKYMVSYLPLDYWEKFYTNWISFGEVMAQKPSRSSQKLYYLLLRKPLKVYNLITRNGITMKLNTIMYLDEAFHFEKNRVVTHRT